MLDLVVIGGGPCGLACAAAAREKGLDYRVLEKSCLVSSISRYPTYMTFFSTSDNLGIAGIPFISQENRPTRKEALKYYRLVAESLELKVLTWTEAISLERQDRGFFCLTTRNHLTGSEDRLEARHVVVATGYFDHPNRLGIPGEDLPKASHYYTEGHPYCGLDVLVVGGKNSAVEAAMDLQNHGARVTLVHRGRDLGEKVKPWILPEIRAKLEKGLIAAFFETRLKAIEPGRVILEHQGEERAVKNDFVFLMTGYHPDSRLLRQAGVTYDEATGEPRHDPATMETNVPGLYVAGVLAAGYDANRIFIENGRFHGQAIVAHILGS